MSEFQKRRAALYAEFPEEAAAYESEYAELQTLLGETNEALASCQSEGQGWKRRAELLEARIKADRAWVLDTLSDFAAKVARDRTTATVTDSASAAPAISHEPDCPWSDQEDRRCLCGARDGAKE